MNTLFEIKGWRDRIKSFEYLLGKLDDEGGMVAGKISAQLLKDIVAQVSKQGDKRIWIFADDSIEALKPEFAKEIIQKIKTDEALQKHIAKNLGIPLDEFAALLRGKKIEDAVKSLMGSF